MWWPSGEEVQGAGVLVGWCHVRGPQREDAVACAVSARGWVMRGCNATNVRAAEKMKVAQKECERDRREQCIMCGGKDDKGDTEGDSNIHLFSLKQVTVLERWRLS